MEPVLLQFIGHSVSRGFACEFETDFSGSMIQDKLLIIFIQGKTMDNTVIDHQYQTSVSLGDLTGYNDLERFVIKSFFKEGYHT